jgi:cell wall-associated NlpC family hydrolase
MHKKMLPSAIVTMLICAMTMIPASAACSGAATVKGSSVNFRSEASTDSSVKAVTYNGAPVVLESKVGSDWYKVIYNGSVGYIAAQYLKCAESLNASFGTAYVNGTGVRLRSGPSTSSSVVGTFSAGDALSVTGVSGKWYKVSINGTAGYMSGDYVSFAKPSETAAAQAVSAGQQIVNTAMKYLGYPYVYGGTTPSGFDCSGFVKYVYGLNGYTLDRTAADQASNGVHVDSDSLQPGDILCFGGSGYIGHVGIYIGGGKFIHASGSTTGVIITELSSSGYLSRLAEARRIV